MSVDALEVPKRQRVRRRIDHTPAVAVAVVLDVVPDAPTPLAPEISPADACVLEHQPPVARDVGRLCKRHYESISNRLEQITALYATLSDVIVPAYTSGPVASQYAPGSEPGRLDVMAITDRRANGQQRPPTEHADPLEAPVFDVLSVLGSWLQRCWQERKLVLFGPGERPGPVMLHGVGSRETTTPHFTLPQVVGQLRSNRHWIAQQAWVPTFLDALELVHRSLARAAGATMWPQPIGKCPNCQAPMWHDAVLAEMATCRRCKTTWSGVALVRLRLIHEQEAR